MSENMVDEPRATRVAREVTIGNQRHRMEVVLEAGREARYVINGVRVLRTDFELVLRLVD